MQADPGLHPLERRERRFYLAGLAPALVLLGVFFAYPLCWMIWLGFDGPNFTAEHYTEILSSEVYLEIIVFTFRISALVTLICLILGYPAAYVLAHASPRTVRLLIIVVILPYFTSVIVRTYAWMVLLGRNGLLNQYISSMFPNRGSVELIYNETGILIGMTYVLLPFMVITLLTTMKGIERQLVLASYSLGASRIYAFLRIFLPLSFPGVASGVLIVFILALGFYITPAMLGGPSNLMISMLIQREVEVTVNWAFASALATVLLLITLLSFGLYARFVRFDRLLRAGA